MNDCFLRPQRVFFQTVWMCLCYRPCLTAENRASRELKHMVPYSYDAHPIDVHFIEAPGSRLQQRGCGGNTISAHLSEMVSKYNWRYCHIFYDLSCGTQHQQRCTIFNAVIKAASILPSWFLLWYVCVYTKSHLSKRSHIRAAKLLSILIVVCI